MSTAVPDVLAHCVGWGSSKPAAPPLPAWCPSAPPPRGQVHHRHSGNSTHELFTQRPQLRRVQAYGQLHTVAVLSDHLSLVSPPPCSGSSLLVLLDLGDVSAPEFGLLIFIFPVYAHCCGGPSISHSSEQHLYSRHK